MTEQMPESVQAESDKNEYIEKITVTDKSGIVHTFYSTKELMEWQEEQHSSEAK